MLALKMNTTVTAILTEASIHFLNEDKEIYAKVITQTALKS
jgi:hypothetical protein